MFHNEPQEKMYWEQRLNWKSHSLVVSCTHALSINGCPAQTFWVNTSLCRLLSSSVPFKETRMKRYPLICETLWSPGPYKNPWTSKDPWPVQCSKRLLFFLFDTKGFGVTTSRTVTAPLKGVVKDTQWSWSSVLISKHEQSRKCWSDSHRVYWDCYYLYECNVIVASVCDEYSVG